MKWTFGILVMQVCFQRFISHVSVVPPTAQLLRSDGFMESTHSKWSHVLECHGPLTRYVKLRVAHAPGMPGTFPCHRLQREPIPACITARAKDFLPTAVSVYFSVTWIVTYVTAMEYLMCMTYLVSLIWLQNPRASKVTPHSCRRVLEQ